MPHLLPNLNKLKGSLTSQLNNLIKRVFKKKKNHTSDFVILLKICGLGLNHQHDSEIGLYEGINFQYSSIS